MATIVLRSVKGSELSHDEVDNNFTNLNNDKIETSAWPTFVGSGASEINVSNVGGTTAVSVASNSLDIDAWCSSSYMDTLLQTLSAGELSANQRAAIAGVVSAIESQISMILSKLDSVA